MIIIIIMEKGRLYCYYSIALVARLFQRRLSGTHIHRTERLNR